MVLLTACSPLTTVPTPVDAIPASPTPIPAPNVGEAAASLSGQYAFPLDAPLDELTWTHYHWDGSNAVDIEAALDMSPLRFADFLTVDVLSPVDGVAYDASGALGGLAYQVFGQDGRVYYLGHLSAQYVADGTVVTAGMPLGRVGNTGRWAQYIEPHLHFAVGTDNLLVKPATINAAEWLRDEFGLNWRDWPDASTIPAAMPTHWPVDDPQVVADFAQVSLENPDLGGIRVVGSSEAVYSPLTGQVNIHRSTAVGNRVQVHNPASNMTVVVSGLTTMSVQDGDVVLAGQVVGSALAGSALHVSVFAPGGMVDPAGVLPGR